jgi:hypothetical protein
MCLTPEAAAERRPKTASEIACRMAEDRLSAARAKLASLPAAKRLWNLRASVKAKLGDIEPDTQAAARIAWTKPFSGFAVEAIELQTEPGLSVPLLLLKPQASSSKRLPVVLTLAQGGKERFLAERNGELAVLLKQGMAICLTDVRGTGEVAPGSSATSLAATELMLDDTPLGTRLKDVRTVLRYLTGRQDLDSRRVVLWGDSFAGVNPRDLRLDQSVGQQPGPQAIQEAQPLGSLLALLTALYEDNVRAVAARRGLVSYLSVLQDRFCYVPLDVIVPGILESADIVDVIAALSPRGVFLEGFVDGRNRLLSTSELEGELRTARAAYRGALSHLIVQEQAAEPELAAWIVAQASR